MGMFRRGIEVIAWHDRFKEAFFLPNYNKSINGLNALVNIYHFLAETTFQNPF